MRPAQWLKNLFIFIPLVFSQNLFQAPLLLRTIYGFLLFCLLSGCVYLLNDLIDLERDRVHPLKSKRPLASGRLGVPQARAALVIFLAGALVASFWLGLAFFGIACGYLVLHVSYSLFLKRVVILDVFVVAAGFVLRVIGGAAVISVEVSGWLLVCTLLLALFLVLGKRRHELVLLNENAQNHRESLGQYSPYLIDQMMAVITASILVTYSIYTMWGETTARFGTRLGTPILAFTIPFVLYGIFRYLYLIHRRQVGGNPEVLLLTDKPLLVAVALWLVAVVAFIYLL